MLRHLFLCEFVNVLLDVVGRGRGELGLLPVRDGGVEIAGFFFELRKAGLELSEHKAAVEIFIGHLEPFRLRHAGLLPRPASQRGFPDVSRAIRIVIIFRTNPAQFKK